MATASVKTPCAICAKGKSSVRCEGCHQIFCYTHFNDHRQQLDQQMDEIQVSRDSFRQILNEQMNNPPKHSFIKLIDRWEAASIAKIQQTAQESRESFIQHTIEHFQGMETSLTRLTERMREVRETNDFNEIELNDLKKRFAKLESELDQIPNISIDQSSSSFISKLSVTVSSRQMIVTPRISGMTRWRQNGTTIAGGNGNGDQLNQLSSPISVYVDDHNQCVYIADCENHRIVQWKSGAQMGQVVAGGNGQGGEINQLSQPTDVIVEKRTDSLIICDAGNKRVVRWPRQNGTSGQTIISDIDCSGIAMNNNGDLYVSDWRKNEVRRWKIGETNGTLVAGGNGRGNKLNQLSFPAYLFVDEDHSVYVSDYSNHRAMKWMKGAREGVIVAGGQGEGDSLTQLNGPTGFIVDHLGNIYVSDSCNHRIMRWPKGSKVGEIILGRNGEGRESNQFANPSRLSFDRQGNLYLVDRSNDRVLKFEIDEN